MNLGSDKVPDVFSNLTGFKELYCSVSHCRTSVEQWEGNAVATSQIEPRTKTFGVEAFKLPHTNSKEFIATSQIDYSFCNCY